MSILEIKVDWFIKWNNNEETTNKQPIKDVYLRTECRLVYAMRKDDNMMKKQPIIYVQLKSNQWLVEMKNIIWCINSQ